MKNILYERERFLVDNGYADETKFIKHHIYAKLTNEQRAQYIFHEEKDLYYPIGCTSHISNDDFLTAYRVEKLRKQALTEKHLHTIKSILIAFTLVAVGISAIAFLMSMFIM